jgi:diguanylate cyclase (GGDEF)-like protein
MSHNNFFNTVNIFSTLSDTDIENIVPYLESVHAAKDEILFSEGDSGSELFIVTSGIIASSINTSDNTQREVAKFYPGNFFGEMAIFENAPRSATCKAIENCALLKMHKTGFLKIIEEHPSIAIKIMHKMLNITSQRLRNTGKFLSDMVRWGNEASKRAVTDELTGVYNRRFLDNAIKDYFQSAVNLGKPVSVVMIDLDHFREINEHYGHETGNRLIQKTASVFKSAFREKDAIARYGGDEFTVILPETNLYEAGQITENVRVQVSLIDLLKEMKGPIENVTLSIGIASYPESTKDLKILRELADKALYKAKEEGRNRIILSGL